MTDLYTEAVRDAQKLREIAENDAKNRLVEQLTPYIKKVIAKEVAGSSDFFFEQEDELEQDETQQQPGQQQQVPADPQGMGEPMATTEPANTVDPTQTLSPDLGNQPAQPVQQAPVPSPEGADEVDATMPDEDGKIVVDFDDLFVDADEDKVTITPDQPEQPGTVAPVEPTTDQAAAAPQADATAQQPEQGQEGEIDLLAGTEEEEEGPTPPLSAEGVSFKEYNRVLSNISERIDRAYFTGRVTDISKGALKQRLFDLLEALDNMRDRGVISGKQARLNENKLEFLFLKLKEARLSNSYKKEDQDKGTDMTSLKEFAAKLFEEDENLAQDSVSADETGLATDEEYSKHAADVSGVDPKLGGPEDVEATQDGSKLSEEMKGGTAGSVDADSVSGDVESDKPWDEGEPVIDEEEQDETVNRSMNENAPEANTDAHDDVVEGAGGFGDTNEEPVSEFEVDDEELAEAVRSIRKENIKRKLEALREASDGKEEESWEDGEPEGGEDGSLDNLKEGMYEMDDDFVDEEEMDEGDLVLSVDLPQEVEEELAALGIDDLDVDVDLNVSDVEDEEDEAEGFEDDDEEEIEVVDDEEGSEEEDVLLTDREDPSVTDRGAVEDDVGPLDDPDYGPRNESKARHLVRKNKILERKLAKAAKLIEAKNRKLDNLNKQLVETNLFTSKAVYYSQFLQRALTEKALSKKALKQIVEHLDRGKSVAETKAIYTKIRRKLDEHANASRKLGGSSSKVTRPGSANLTEAAQPQVGQDSSAQSPNRWQVLAGIKKTD